MAQVRLGPIAYGPNGHRSAQIGPLGMTYNANSPFMNGLMALVTAVAIISALWPFLLALGVLTVLVIALNKRRHGLRRPPIQPAQSDAIHTWPHRPAPALALPTRFSEQWFAANVPSLHPAQVPLLRAEMKSRGWTNRHIAQRLDPYLRQNPAYPEM